MAGHGIDVGSCRPIKSAPGPIPTLGQLVASEPRWLWLRCTNYTACHHQPAIPLVPLIIRWGADASSDVLRGCALCSRCGNKGAETYHPSVDVGLHGCGLTWQLFPTERRALICWPD